MISENIRKQPLSASDWVTRIMEDTMGGNFGERSLSLLRRKRTLSKKGGPVERFDQGGMRHDLVGASPKRLSTFR